jgi:hypothetical protein
LTISASQPYAAKFPGIRIENAMPIFWAMAQYGASQRRNKNQAGEHEFTHERDWYVMLQLNSKDR